jgi:hypothetical protein
MMVELRALTAKGTELFRDYILQVKLDPGRAVPLDQISHSPWSSEFVPHIEVGGLSATSRIEFGKYLVELFEASGVERKDLLSNPGVWSWLALLWFDSLCPIEADGSRRVRETARYVCSTDYTDYYRHLVASSWDIYYIHRDKSRLFLWTPLHTHNDFIEQLASRQNIITNCALIEVFDHLYWNPALNHPRSGAQSRGKPGNFRRLLSFIQQVELTYDLQAMSLDDILGLLPAEYDSWKVVA